MVMEKAYAKLHGCYENLVSGYIDFGLRDLTGAATMKMKFSNKNVKKMIKNGQLWENISKWKAEGSLMGCSMAGGGTEHDMGMGILAVSSISEQVDACRIALGYLIIITVALLGEHTLRAMLTGYCELKQSKQKPLTMSMSTRESCCRLVDVNVCWVWTSSPTPPHTQTSPHPTPPTHPPTRHHHHYQHHHHPHHPHPHHHHHHHHHHRHHLHLHCCRCWV
jgi:hypothetical protein